MKRTWIAVVMIALAVPATAVAQGPVAAWCGGSYGADGTNFGECVTVEREVQVAGQGSGVKRETVNVQTRPEYPATMVTFENGAASFVGEDRDGRPIKQELRMKWRSAPGGCPARC
jgi:hypothetical protein